MQMKHDFLGKTEEKTLPEQKMEIIAEIQEELSSIQSEQTDDNTFDRQTQFLEECMDQNLEHARHVEGERLDFIQIHLVLVGAVFAILADSAFEKKSYLVLLILVGITVLGFFIKQLITRWDQVFIAHRACAMFCYEQIVQLCKFQNCMRTEFPSGVLQKVRKKIPPELRSDMPLYAFTFSKSGKTGTIIRWFTNGLILTTGTVAAAYLFNFWILPFLQ